MTAAGPGFKGDAKYPDSSPMAIDGAETVTNSLDNAYNDWSITGNVPHVNAPNL